MKSTPRGTMLLAKAYAVLVLACICLGAPAQAGTVLTREEAIERDALISDVDYTLSFALNAVDKHYTGITRIDFNLRQSAQAAGTASTFVDFQGGEVRSLTVNGEAWKKFSYQDDRIQLPLEKLKPGANRVEVTFKRAYNTNGRGLHRFQDPADGNIYTFTNLEPYAAREVFPCFDQPDLKASFTMEVTVPEDWLVIANTRESSIASQGTRKIWRFPKSARFSTYVWAMHTGPYHAWESPADTRIDTGVDTGAGVNIPMRVLARQSEKAYVQPEFWFKVTAAGFDFYAEKFGIAYPFGKYDQILVPEFNHGAMENVGAVTFAERFAYRSPPTAKQRLDHAEVILHELAHMWFGDLVTMKWWNDLWLNESFASFMASWAIDNVGDRFDVANAWQGFFVDMKHWAYWQDQLVTTHPILSRVEDTATAFSIFDGITYGKGGSTLKQLYFLLGDQSFSQGLRTYFKRHAYGNTELNDFIAALSDASKQDLASWQTAWLQSKGANTLRVDWDCDAKGISKFNLIQGYAEHADEVLRPHRTQVALYAQTNDKLVTSRIIPVAYGGQRTQVKAAIGASCPAAVLANYGDFDYAKITLDDRSLSALQTNLSKLDDPLARAMVWHSLFEDMTAGKLSPERYAEFVLRHLPPENDLLILDMVLADVQRDITYRRRSASRATLARYQRPVQRAEFLAKMEDITYARFLTAPTESSMQTFWFETFLSMVHSDKALKTIHGWLASKDTIGFKLNNERRWRIVINLARNGYGDAEALISAELKREDSDFARTEALTARAAIPGVENKKRWFERAVRRDQDQEKLPFGKIRKAMNAVQSLDQEGDSEFLIDEYFTALPGLREVENDAYLDAYSENMFPGHCDKRVLDNAREFLKTHAQDMSIDVLKNIRVGVQETERCLRARG